ncbi:MAG: hypothetical protein ACREN4_07420 [Candidatus Dormibacteria bacterium]
MAAGLPPPTSGPSATAYLAVVLLVGLAIVLVVLSINPGVLDHMAGLRHALGLPRG